MANDRKRPAPSLSELEIMPPVDDPQEVITQVHDNVTKRKTPSVSTLPESEEALRVFDEMSGLRTFGGEPSAAGQAPIRRKPRRAAPSRSEAHEASTAAFSSAPSLEEIPGGLDSQEEAAYWDAWLIFENTPCPLFRLDGEGRICTANPATWTFLGESAEELTGMRLMDTRLGKNFPNLQQELRNSTRTGQALQRLLAFQADESRTVRFLLWIVPLPYDSPPVAFSGIILPYPGNLE